MILGDI
jgi:hypothetical protein